MSETHSTVKLMSKKESFELYAPNKINCANLLGVFEDGTSEWHEARADGIGGSEVSAILGLNEYESPYSLWAKKVGEVPILPVENWSVRFGKAFEEPILRLWAEDNPDYTVYRTGTYADGDLPFMRANPDALAQHKDGHWIVIEIKTSRNSWVETPSGYEAQVMHYMDILGIEKAVIVAVAGWNYYEDWIDYDDFVARAQREAIEKFWKYVVDNERPSFDGSDATYETVRRRHPEIDEDLSIEIDGIHHLAHIAEKFDQAKADLNQAKSEVLDVMGKAKYAYFEHDGEKHIVATRQARGEGLPYLVIKKGKR